MRKKGIKYGPVWNMYLCAFIVSFFGTKCKDPRPVAEKQTQTKIFFGGFHSRNSVTRVMLETWWTLYDCPVCAKPAEC